MARHVGGSGPAPPLRSKVLSIIAAVVVGVAFVLVEALVSGCGAPRKPLYGGSKPCMTFSLAVTTTEDKVPTKPMKEVKLAERGLVGDDREAGEGGGTGGGARSGKSAVGAEAFAWWVL